MYDDERQIDRWAKLAGPNGRFRRRLMNEVIKKGKKYDDLMLGSVIRQVLLHWGYELTKKDFDEYKKTKKINVNHLIGHLQIPRPTCKYEPLAAPPPVPSQSLYCTT